MKPLLPLTLILAAILFSCEKNKPNLMELTIQEIASAIKSREITATEVVQTCIDNHKKNEGLNAFITFLEEESLQKAKAIDQRIKNGEEVGKLAGIPFCVKDNIFVKGIPTTAGSEALKDFIPTYSSEVVRKLLDQDAILIGKNNMHELAFGITGLNASFGYVKNPYDQSKIAGGSSSGTAVSVSVGSALLGIGTDTGGSVRIPASLTNLYGFRPSPDRYDNRGLVNLSKTRDVQGIIARHLEDVAFVDAVLTTSQSMTQAKENSQYRLGFPKAYYRERLSPEVSRLMEGATEKLKTKGFTLVEKDIPNIGQLDQNVSFPVVLYETKQEVNKLIAQEALPITVDTFIENIRSPDVKQTMQMVFSETDGIPEEVYQQAVTRHRDSLIVAFRKYFSDNRLDAIVFPLTVIEATSIEACLSGQILMNGQQVPVFPTYINNTDPGSNSGMPGMTIPIGLTSDNLPVGLGIDGMISDDDALLTLSIQIAKALTQK